MNELEKWPAEEHCVLEELTLRLLKWGSSSSSMLQYTPETWHNLRAFPIHNRLTKRF